MEKVLVTGGSGHLGSAIILQLLNIGYGVKTTIRSENKIDLIKNTLRKGGVKNFDKLEFIVADLNEDENWDIAVDGCNYVLHTASPIPNYEPADDNEIILPAVNGTLRVLKAARDGQSKRVVITSSFAAIGYSIKTTGYIFTENDWTDESKPNTAYIRSKVLAEKAAWDFIEKEGAGLELSVINPTGIFGPVLNTDFSVSIQLMKDLLKGDCMNAYNFWFGIIDVRDLALLHLNAMVDPKANGHRFLATAGDVTNCYEIAELIIQNRPQWAGSIGTIKPVDSIHKFGMSNKKIKEFFNWNPISWQDAILATVDSLD